MTRVAGVFLLAAASFADNPEGVKESVTYATSWEAAVEEAASCNVPIVVHRHGFYWGPCWSMHGSVLQDKSYIRFAAENSVEVISMEEMEKALAEKGAMVRTYTSKDAYGDEVECLAEFPGLTIAQLERLSDGKAIEYMEGGKIPYTAIVNPHTLEPMEGMKGKKSSRELMDAVARHRKALEAEHGPGLPRKSWNELAEGQVAIDVALAAGDIPKAMKIARGLERLVERGHEHARRKAASSLRVVLSDAGERLDEAEQLRDAGKAKEAAEIAASLAPALQGTELQGRVEALRAKAKP